MGLEAKARATEDQVKTTTCMPGTYDKKIFIYDEKVMLISTPKFLVTYGVVTRVNDR